MVAKPSNAGFKRYLVEVEGEYYTHPRAEGGREHFKDTVILSEQLEKHGYLYACKKFLTEKYSKIPQFRRLRTCSIISSSVIGGYPEEEVKILELMSFENLRKYVAKNFRDINLDLYYTEATKDELIQAVYSFREDPTAAKDHQIWKATKQADRIEMHKLMRELNIEDVTL